MAQRIESVDRGSAADRAGLRAGDEILRISGQNVIDLLDYQALTCEKHVPMTCRRDGKEFSVTLKKGEYDSPGLNFAQPLMSGMRMCCNRCLFCFVDQLPGNVRSTLRVKDDDWRMSLMTGSYVTLTNVSDTEIKRIIERNASPLYISVHAVTPELRSRILGQPRGERIMHQLKLLSDGGITFHTQAVLCPGLNDGDELDRMIGALSELPGALSLALVPVGLTGHRDGLCPLRTYRPEEAREVLRIAQAWRDRLLKEKGTRFVFPSDEFYLQANVEPPSDEEYEGYGQIDDGVGLLRLLDTEFSQAYEELDASDKKTYGDRRTVLIGCGVSAAAFLNRLLQEHPLTGIQVKVLPVVNQFFGESVTVSGLITGRDLTDRLKNEEGECILVTECMLRDEGDRFLDDMTLEEAQTRTGRRIIPVGRRGWDLLDALLAVRKESGGSTQNV